MNGCDGLGQDIFRVFSSYSFDNLGFTGLKNLVIIICLLGWHDSICLRDPLRDGLTFKLLGLPLSLFLKVPLLEVPGLFSVRVCWKDKRFPSDVRVVWTFSFSLFGFVEDFLRIYLTMGHESIIDSLVMVGWVIGV